MTKLERQVRRLCTSAKGQMFVVALESGGPNGDRIVIREKRRRTTERSIEVGRLYLRLTMDAVDEQRRTRKVRRGSRLAGA